MGGRGVSQELCLGVSWHGWPHTPSCPERPTTEEQDSCPCQAPHPVLFPLNLGPDFLGYFRPYDMEAHGHFFLISCHTDFVSSWRCHVESIPWSCLLTVTTISA